MRDRLDSQQVSTALMDCAVYEDGLLREGRLSPYDALTAAQEKDGFAWISLHDPSVSVMENIGELFGLHELAVEDAVHSHQRPKLEMYDDVLLVVLKTARYVDSQELVEIGELMVFVGERFVITVRRGEGSALREVRRRLDCHPELRTAGPLAVLHAVADKVADDYAEVLDGFELDVEQVEVEVFSDQGGNAAQRIYKLKREVLEFKRAVAPLVGPMSRLADSHLKPTLPSGAGTYFRDVHDHVVRVTERIQHLDELLNGVLQANIAQISMRDNQDMRRISAWIAIIAVPTMLFGMYGMNFKHMPELDFKYGYPAAMAVVLTICGVLYWRFKRAGWL